MFALGSAANMILWCYSHLRFLLLRRQCNSPPKTQLSLLTLHSKRYLMAIGESGFDGEYSTSLLPPPTTHNPTPNGTAQTLSLLVRGAESVSLVSFQQSFDLILICSKCRNEFPELHERSVLRIAEWHAQRHTAELLPNRP